MSHSQPAYFRNNGPKSNHNNKPNNKPNKPNRGDENAMVSFWKTYGRSYTDHNSYSYWHLLYTNSFKFNGGDERNQSLPRLSAGNDRASRFHFTVDAIISKEDFEIIQFMFPGLLFFYAATMKRCNSGHAFLRLLRRLCRNDCYWDHVSRRDHIFKGWLYSVGDSGNEHEYFRHSHIHALAPSFSVKDINRHSYIFNSNNCNTKCGCTFRQMIDASIGQGNDCCSFRNNGNFVPHHQKYNHELRRGGRDEYKWEERSTRSAHAMIIHCYEIMAEELASALFHGLETIEMVVHRFDDIKTGKGGGTFTENGFWRRTDRAGMPDVNGDFIVMDVDGDTAQYGKRNDGNMVNNSRPHHSFDWLWEGFQGDGLNKKRFNFADGTHVTIGWIAMRVYKGRNGQIYAGCFRIYKVPDDIDADTIRIYDKPKMELNIFRNKLIKSVTDDCLSSDWSYRTNATIERKINQFIKANNEKYGTNHKFEGDSLVQLLLDTTKSIHESKTKLADNTRGLLVDASYQNNVLNFNPKAIENESLTKQLFAEWRKATIESVFAAKRMIVNPIVNLCRKICSKTVSFAVRHPFATTLIVGVMGFVTARFIKAGIHYVIDNTKPVVDKVFEGIDFMYNSYDKAMNRAGKISSEIGIEKDLIVSKIGNKIGECTDVACDLTSGLGGFIQKEVKGETSFLKRRATEVAGTMLQENSPEYIRLFKDERGWFQKRWHRFKGIETYTDYIKWKCGNGDNREIFKEIITSVGKDYVKAMKSKYYTPIFGRDWKEETSELQLDLLMCYSKFDMIIPSAVLLGYYFYRKLPANLLSIIQSWLFPSSVTYERYDATEIVSHCTGPRDQDYIRNCTFAVDCPDYMEHQCQDKIAAYVYGPRIKNRTPIFFRKCVHNAVNSFFNRIVLDVNECPKYKGDYDEEVAHNCFEWNKQNFNVIFPYIEPKEPVDYDKWLSNYRSNKLVETIEAEKDLQQLTKKIYDLRDYKKLITKYNYREVFNKNEGLLIDIKKVEKGSKHARIIMAPPPIMKNFSGPVCYTYGKQLNKKLTCKGVDFMYNGPELFVYCSGYNRFKIGEIYQYLFNKISVYGKVIVLMSDHDRFDLHHTAKAFETQFYSMKQLVNCSDEIEYWMEDSLNMRGRFMRHNITFSGLTMRGSGGCETTQGNTFLNASSMGYAWWITLNQVGYDMSNPKEEEARFQRGESTLGVYENKIEDFIKLPLGALLLGDDNETLTVESIATHQEIFTHVMSKIGWSLKVDVCSPIKSEFCSSIFVTAMKEDGERLIICVNKPIRVMAKFAHSLKNRGKRVKFLAYVKAVLLGYAEQDIIPFMKAWRQRLLYLIDSEEIVMNNKNYFDILVERGVIDRAKERRQDWRMSNDKYGPNIYTCHETMCDLMERYEVGYVELESLKNYLANIPALNVILDHPVIYKMFDIDCYEF